MNSIQQYYKYSIRKKLVMIFVVIFASLQGMNEANDQNISILDYNNDECLSGQLNNHVAYSGIFGATPRYSLFRKYCIKILQHYKSKEYTTTPPSKTLKKIFVKISRHYSKKLS